MHEGEICLKYTYSLKCIVFGSFRVVYINIQFGEVCLPYSRIRSVYVLSTASEERGVLGVWSIPIPILPSCQDMKTICIIIA